MKKQRNILLRLFIIMILLVACGSGELGEENRSMENSVEGEDSEMISGIRMTREYAIEHGILTEEELVGIDFEAMAERYDWLEGSELTRDIKGSFLRHKKKFPLPGYGFDYTWLVSVTEQETVFSKDDVGQIKAIGFEYQSGNAYVSMIFDFTESKAYYGYNVFLFKRTFEPELTMEISLTGEQIEELERIMSDSAVDTWDKRYEGTNDDSTGEFWWNLYYALEDGRIYSNSGSGVLGSTPDNYDILEKGLEAFWKEEQ